MDVIRYLEEKISSVRQHADSNSNRIRRLEHGMNKLKQENELLTGWIYFLLSSMEED